MLLVTSDVPVADWAKLLSSPAARSAGPDLDAARARLASLPAEGVDHVGHALALRDQYVRLPQLGDHILRLVPLRAHLSVLVLARRPYLRADHFSGGGSIQNDAQNPLGYTAADSAASHRDPVRKARSSPADKAPLRGAAQRSTRDYPTGPIRPIRAGVVLV
jgi:hypothetical protein